MRLLFVDYETYYDQDYSLRLMTPIEYILDARFETLGAAVAFDREPSRWIEGPDLLDFFGPIDWKNTAQVSHNIQFDGSITAWRYGHRPGFYIDTLGMARSLIYGVTGSAALSAVAKHLGVPPKGTTIVQMKGYRLRELKANPGLYRAAQDYAINDNDICREAYFRLRDQVPRAEWIIMDMLIRMVVQPQLLADRNALQMNLNEVRRRKQALMDKITADKDALMSNDKFAQLLLDAGVDPPTKLSPATGKVSWAFSKQDTAFKELLEHDDEVVQALVAARLGVKSTQDETRSIRYLNVHDASTRHWGVGWMPMPLKYSAAHTHRFGGDWSLNVQNLPRDDKELKDAYGNALPHPLRYAMVAPEGYVVLQVDSSNIEARLNAWVSGCTSLLEQYRNKVDSYAKFASKVYERPINKKDHPVERFVGKTSILGLGYGMAAPRFQHTLRVQGPPEMPLMPLSECMKVVNLYRMDFREIPANWNKSEALLPFIQAGTPTTHGPLTIEKDAIVLPNGMKIRYRNLRQEMWTKPGFDRPMPTWVYDWGKRTKTLFGGKVVENYTQALARIVVMDAGVRMRRRYPWLHMALQIHDSLVYVVPKAWADEILDACIQEMRVPPAWAPDLPLDAEGGYGPTLADAK